MRINLVIKPNGKLSERPWIILKARSLGMTTVFEALRMWYESDHDSNYKFIQSIEHASNNYSTRKTSLPVNGKR